MFLEDEWLEACLHFVLSRSDIFLFFYTRTKMIKSFDGNFVHRNFFFRKIKYIFLKVNSARASKDIRRERGPKKAPPGALNYFYVNPFTVSNQEERSDSLNDVCDTHKHFFCC